MLAAVGQVKGLQPVIGDHVSLLLSPVMPFFLFVLMYTLLLFIVHGLSLYSAEFQIGQILLSMYGLLGFHGCGPAFCFFYLLGLICR